MSEDLENSKIGYKRIEPFIEDSKAFQILEVLYQAAIIRKNIKITELQKYVPTYSKLNKILESLELYGYITITDNRDGGKKKLVSITTEGMLFRFGLDIACDQIDDFLYSTNIMAKSTKEGPSPDDQSIIDSFTPEERAEMYKLLGSEFEELKELMLYYKMHSVGILDDDEFKRLSDERYFKRVNQRDEKIRTFLESASKAPSGNRIEIVDDPTTDKKANDSKEAQ